MELIKKLTSVIYAFEYMIGLAVFGFFYWLMNGILVEFQFISVQDTTYTLAMFFWAGILIVYIIFGIWYFIIRIKTWRIFTGK